MKNKPLSKADVQKATKRITEKVDADKELINEVATQIGKILQSHGLGMQAAIEIFKLQKPDITQEGIIPGKLQEGTTPDGTITNVTPENLTKILDQETGDKIN